MGIGEFFHKIGVGFTRLGENSIPHTTQAKRYGNWGEDEFVYHIRTHLPNCQIKRNIVIQTLEGNAEIDCLILYNNKLFAIEIKRWKGELTECDGQFVQRKLDRWTDEWHTKIQKSPFRQLSRAIYLLRKQVTEKAWINSIVYFEDADRISINNENTWFDNVYSLTEYIQNNGQVSYGNNAQAFFNQCIPADYLYSNHNEDEGEMTKVRASYVCENALSEYANKLCLSKFVKVGHGEEKEGGKTKKSILADIFEALIGAIYLDLGYATARRTVLNIIVPIKVIF